MSWCVVGVRQLNIHSDLSLHFLLRLQIEEEVASEIVAWKTSATPQKRTELVHEEPRKLHEEHDVGEDKFALLQRLMKNLSQIYYVVGEKVNFFLSACLSWNNELRHANLYCTHIFT